MTRQTSAPTLHEPDPSRDDDEHGLDDATPTLSTEERAALVRQYKIDAEGSLRLDKWLWAARLFKTRSVAAEEVTRGRIRINSQAVAKPAREVRAGDLLSVRLGDCPLPRELQVCAVSVLRGPAPAARLLYVEIASSVAAQAQWRAGRAFQADPASAIEHGRPTKVARRQLANWQRWSVTLDDES